MLNSKSRFSQMMIALFVAVTGIVLIQNYSFVNESFISSVLSVIISLAVFLILIIPTRIISKKTDLSFIEFARRETPSAVFVISMVYSLYFVYAVVNFLLKYSSVFTSTGNRNDIGYVIALIMLAVCVFASSRGIGAVARCSLFVFAFAVIALALIFGGNTGFLDFSKFEFDFDGAQLQYSSAIFAMTAFSAVIFSFFEYKGKTRIRSLVFFVAGIAVLLMLVVLFVFFALGNYGTMQSYQIFILSKAADFGNAGGIDSFHLSLCAMSVFILVSLCFICIGRAVDKDENVWCMTAFACISYVLYLTAEQYNSVREIIMNPYVFVIFTAMVSFVIPIIYIAMLWRRLNA